MRRGRLSRGGVDGIRDDSDEVDFKGRYLVARERILFWISNEPTFIFDPELWTFPVGPNPKPTDRSSGSDTVSVEIMLSLFVWWIKGA